MGRRKQTIHEWLDIKAERDMYRTINATDPYVKEYNDPMMDEDIQELFDRLGSNGVDEV
jgi:hypothetical protein